MGESTMQRKLKHRHLQLISSGGVIGSGYFLGTGYVIEQAGPASVISYLLGGLIVLAVMLCLAELAVEQPLSGSFVVYARENISAAWACGVGWSYWVTWVSYVPSEMIAAGIIMNGLLPEVGTIWWAVFFGLIVTIINLFRVDKFGESEFWLSLVKILALVAFSVVALLICLGLIGEEGYIGTRILLGSGGFAPHGYWSIALTMVIILVNFQGAEIIGLAAGETADPAKSIPVAVRNVTWRIIALYIVPITLLISILPWDRATLTESVFAAALLADGRAVFLRRADGRGLLFELRALRRRADGTRSGDDGDGAADPRGTERKGNSIPRDLCVHCILLGSDRHLCGESACRSVHLSACALRVLGRCGMDIHLLEPVSAAAET